MHLGRLFSSLGLLQLIQGLEKYLTLSPFGQGCDSAYVKFVSQSAAAMTGAADDVGMPLCLPGRVLFITSALVLYLDCNFVPRSIITAMVGHCQAQRIYTVWQGRCVPGCQHAINNWFIG